MSYLPIILSETILPTLLPPSQPRLNLGMWLVTWGTAREWGPSKRPEALFQFKGFWNFRKTSLFGLSISSARSVSGLLWYGIWPYDLKQMVFLANSFGQSLKILQTQKIPLSGDASCNLNLYFTQLLGFRTTMKDVAALAIPQGSRGANTRLFWWKYSENWNLHYTE